MLGTERLQPRLPYCTSHSDSGLSVFQSAPGSRVPTGLHGALTEPSPELRRTQQARTVLRLLLCSA